MVGIGCEVHTISEWMKEFRDIGNRNGYSPDQIAEYKRYLDLFATEYGW
jgi:hypothetical protein